jgi:two-component sensor histidine kinase
MILAKNIFRYIDKAIPCSLILNELLSNSLRHVLQNDRTGMIRIDVTHEGDTINLLNGDNGFGMPESVTRNHTGSLGMRFITGLVRQLKRTIDIQRSGGTTFVITFNV